MPSYRVRMINSEFESFEEVDYPSLESARRAAVATATKIAAESIIAGAASVAVELQIDQNGKMLLREVVSISLADLMGGERPPPI
jgi:Domain of unknown function (DUF6894)